MKLIINVEGSLFLFRNVWLEFVTKWMITGPCGCGTYLVCVIHLHFLINTKLLP